MTSLVHRFFTCLEEADVFQIAQLWVVLMRDLCIDRGWGGSFCIASPVCIQVPSQSSCTTKSVLQNPKEIQPVSQGSGLTGVSSHKESLDVFVTLSLNWRLLFFSSRVEDG